MDASSGLPELAIIGTGMNKLTQMTLESWRVLHESDAVVCILSDGLASEYLSESLSGEFYDFSSMYNYRSDTSRHTTYYNAIMKCKELLREKDGVVTFLAVGHPSLWSFVAQMTHKLAESNWGYDVQILPNISAASAMYAELGIDPESQGVVHLSFNEAYTNGIQVDSSFTLIAWLFSRYDMDLNISSQDAVEYLSNQYPRDRKAYLVRIGNSVFEQSDVITTTIQGIEDIDPERIRGYTLVVPGTSYVNKYDGGSVSLPDFFSRKQKGLLAASKDQVESIDITPRESELEANGGTDVVAFLTKVIEDDDFFIKMIEDPEAAVSEFNMPDEFADSIINSVKNKNSDEFKNLVYDYIEY